MIFSNPLSVVINQPPIIKLAVTASENNFYAFDKAKAAGFTALVEKNFKHPYHPEIWVIMDDSVIIGSDFLRSTAPTVKETYAFGMGGHFNGDDEDIDDPEAASHFGEAWRVRIKVLGTDSARIQGAGGSGGPGQSPGGHPDSGGGGGGGAGSIVGPGGIGANQPDPDAGDDGDDGTSTAGGLGGFAGTEDASIPVTDASGLNGTRALSSFTIFPDQEDPDLEPFQNVQLFINPDVGATIEIWGGGGGGGGDNGFAEPGVDRAGSGGGPGLDGGPGNFPNSFPGKQGRGLSLFEGSTGSTSAGLPFNGPGTLDILGSE